MAPMSGRLAPWLRGIGPVARDVFATRFTTGAWRHRSPASDRSADVFATRFATGGWRHRSPASARSAEVFATLRDRSLAPPLRGIGPIRRRLRPRFTTGGYD